MSQKNGIINCEKMINYSTVHALDLIFAQIYKIALIPKRREKYKETKEGYIGFYYDEKG
jgi:hypothetical protein